MIKENIHILTALFLFILLKVGYTQTNAEDLLFLLYPTDVLVSIFTNSSSSYIRGSGYFHAELNILIEKSCAGFNFLILYFLVSYFTCLQHFRKPVVRWMMLPICCIGSYLITLGVNTSRIITAISLNKSESNFLNTSWMHQLQGTFIYLFFLLLSYLILKYFLNKYALKNEKLA